MKKISVFLLVMLFVYSCNDMYDSINDFVGEETVYPGGFDMAEGRIGYERVEIDLMNAGRIPSSEMKLGKAKKTIVEYDGREISIDSLCSWLNIEGLTLSRLYRFKIYTVDEFGDKSIPVETALIPYTAGDKDNLAILAPRISYWADEVTVSWSSSLTSVSLNYCALSFSYTDKSGVVRKGEQTGDRPAFTAYNLAPGSQVTVNLRHAVIPKVNNVAILDTVYIENPLVLNIP
jgi:hypothetical protein